MKQTFVIILCLLIAFQQLAEAQSQNGGKGNKGKGNQGGHENGQGEYERQNDKN